MSGDKKLPGAWRAAWWGMGRWRWLWAGLLVVWAVLVPGEMMK